LPLILQRLEKGPGVVQGLSTLLSTSIGMPKPVENIQQQQVGKPCCSGGESRLLPEHHLLPLNPKRASAIGLITILLVGVFFLAPVVSYSKSFGLPYNYEPGADAYCLNLARENSTSTPPPLNSSEIDIYNGCMNAHLYAPVPVAGYASLSFALLGIGAPPFPNHVFISQGNYSALIYFDGTQDVARYLFGGPSVEINPDGVVQIVNASVDLSGYGGLYFQGAIKNIGASPVTSLGALITGLHLPAYAWVNTSRDGVVWTPMFVDGNCGAFLKPGQSCRLYDYWGNGTLPNQSLHFYVNVLGETNGNLFFYRQEFEQSAPQSGVSRDWVNLFVSQFNQQRKGPAMVENATLDDFAEKRFNTASSQPGISDYGLSADTASFFGASAEATKVVELLLYPGSTAPYPFAASLQGSAPKHYAALMNSSYTQFGYYIGEAPYFLVSANCAVKEIPSAGINITQYFEGYGCTVTPVPDMTWLVIILAP